MRTTENGIDLAAIEAERARIRDAHLCRPASVPPRPRAGCTTPR